MTRDARRAWPSIALAALTALTACNAVFGLDPLSYEAPKATPLPEGGTPALDADAVDGDASEGEAGLDSGADVSDRDAATGLDSTPD